MNSAEYWRLREEKQRLKNIKDEKEYDKKIKEIYQRMMDEVQSEINNFYAKYAKDTGITMAEAKKRASNLDMEAYSRKAKKYVEEKDFSKQANEEMKLYNMTMKVNRLELLKANIGLALTSGHDELEKYMDELLENRTLDEIQRQAGILGSTILDNADTVHSIVNASFHNATFSDRIWMHQDLLKHDLESLLSTGLIQGKNPNELARLLRKRFNVKISDAQRLMRTELARVQIDAQQRSYEANGIDEYEYITCGIGDACDTCRVLDGKIFPINRMNIGDNAPPMHPNCHCSTGPHMDIKLYDEWLDGIANGKHTLTFDEYKKASGVKNDLKKQITALSKNEKEILTRYTGNLAMQMNFALNTGRERKFKKELELLDKALSNGVINDSITVYRKADAINYIKGVNASLDELKKLVGQTIVEKGYTSTSFNYFDNINLLGRNMYIEFVVPKGYKGALYIKPLAYKMVKSQEELLFKRGLCYNVIKVEEKDGCFYIKAEVIKND
jgi:SPP1 gp7 family putative phage head morphogenesis protein